MKLLKNTHTKVRTNYAKAFQKRATRPAGERKATESPLALTLSRWGWML